jgi:hypothetical protein
MGVKAAAPRYKIGDVVGFWDGVRRAVARVLEPRGPLGVNRRHLYRLRVMTGADEPVVFEMPEEELDPAVPTEDEVVGFLVTGGLVDMLGKHGKYGRNPARVWLTYNPIGVMTYTFFEEDGLVGGANVPPGALNDDGKIGRRKKGEVLQLLHSFGLSPACAESVMESVGTSIP